MARVLIIGYGNPLRCDDGVGWRAAEQLSTEIGDEDVEILARQQLTPELAEAISRCKRVIFIDACIDCHPGSIKIKKILPVSASDNIFLHHLTPTALMTMARVLYKVFPEAFVLTVGGYSCDFGERLSPAAAKALPALLETVKSMVAELR